MEMKRSNSNTLAQSVINRPDLNKVRPFSSKLESPLGKSERNFLGSSVRISNPVVRRQKEDSLFDGSANIIIPQTGVKVRFY